MTNMKAIVDMFSSMSLLEKIEWVNDKFYDRVYTFEFPLPCKDNVAYRREINDFLADMEIVGNKNYYRVSEEVSADWIYFDEVERRFYEFDLDSKADNDMFDILFLEDMLEWVRIDIEEKESKFEDKPF